MTTFETLNAINVNDKTEQKNGLTYLSWAWAWAEVKKAFPEATYSIRRFDNNLPYVYDEATGYMVFTEVTISGITHEMWLPVMDNSNKAMKSQPYKYRTWDRFKKEWKENTVASATMFDINKAIMRCLTKNLSMFGLGLYIYAGEDTPEEITDKSDAVISEPKPKPEPKAATISKSQAETLEALIKETGADEIAFCKHYKVLTPDKLRVEDYVDAIKLLEQKKQSHNRIEDELPEALKG